MTHLPVQEALLHPFITTVTMSRLISYEYRSCLKANSNLTEKALLVKCVPNLLKACKRAEFRAIKTIRMSVKLAKTLMESFPSLKLIYGHRDPRGIVLSRKRLEPKLYTKQSVIAKTTEELCVKMRQDLDELDRMENIDMFKDRVLRVRYETLALDPLVTAKSVYDFAHFQGLSTFMKNWLIRYTHSSEIDLGQTSVKRNATKVVGAWRKEMNPSLQQFIWSRCRDVVDRLGYS